jgi:hypothetical protein
MLNEHPLRRLLRQHDLVLAIGLYSERRVFDSRPSIPNVLGWVDYVGHVLVDGDQWEAVALRPLERHRPSHVQDDYGVA